MRDKDAPFSAFDKDGPVPILDSELLLNPWITRSPLLLVPRKASGVITLLAEVSTKLNSGFVVINRIAYIGPNPQFPTRFSHWPRAYIRRCLSLLDLGKISSLQKA